MEYYHTKYPDKLVTLLKPLPMALQDKYINPFPDIGFKKLFDDAEIARFKPEEKQQYIAGLKYYRDLSNIIDTSYDEGIAKGRV